ncbi:MAG: hypothetical protein HYU41_21985 [Candidatus Rokubacteria bacterium]|nr:hypothetical protein [Candidatus Rokubacteria bacterium]
MHRMPILVLMLIMAPCGTAHGGDVRAAARSGPADAAALVGAWTGQWTAAPDSRPRPLEMILTRGRSDGVVVGQFTFLTTGHAWTARREGVVVDGAVRFELPAGGAIVVRVIDADRLTGEFTGAQGALPAERGSFELSRAR